MSMTVDMTKFRSAIAAVAAQSKRPFADIVNKALLDVAHKSAQFTPKTTAGKVRASLPNQLLTRIARKSLAEKQGNFTKEQLRDEKEKIRKRRRKGIGGVRAGWIPAIIALGGRYGGAKMRKGGSAAHGTGKKAGVWRKAGMIRNSVVTTQFASNSQTGAGNIPFAIRALDIAVRVVARDRQAHADRKARVGKVLIKNSDK